MSKPDERSSVAWVGFRFYHRFDADDRSGGPVRECDDLRIPKRLEDELSAGANFETEDLPDVDHIVVAAQIR